MTASELDELISAGRSRDKRAAREKELLAFNIGALALAAFNAPARFPKTPDEAFGRSSDNRPDGGKADFMKIAERLNRKTMNKGDEL